ncbi:hypothetical protein GCM10017691_37830 [Pseudonocardia petroleophila]|uniref:DUF8175 domain-containing protein n=1 Tax=Pseudonocardia petroleophila TaxID=37331 RepID=A0A7G7MCG0_9PSEU|nr:hypothetical protein [Pseudonocardia petroleophila]QNG50471.1 hypothetical protein H6H00_19810 [Pseudonocardia petroleophila]
MKRSITALAILLAAVACTGPPSESIRFEQVALVAVPGGVAAQSLRHGPFRVDGARASGFSHDALGAALAASHISPRITAAAGAAISGPTLAEQCFGDIDDAQASLDSALPLPDSPTADDLTPVSLHYRVIAGDPAGDHVVVSLLADTPQARSRGGLSRVDATLRWYGQDWQLQVPARRPSLQPDTTGYALLGPTP